MSTAKICSQCGAALSSDAPPGLCPQCLLPGVLTPDAPQPSSTTRKVTSPMAHPADVNSGLGTTVRFFGDYELLEEIARGGMGVVFKARQESLNRIVAVKMIRGGSLDQAEARKRFHTEAQAAAHLQHPNIVAIHEVGEVDGQPFFSMDYVEGRSLADIVREGPLDPRRAASYVQIIAAAIQQAHEHGILHRDLKPSNVLIDRHDQPRVTDFGLAKVMSGDTELTMSGTVMGSPCYMAPEQAEGKIHSITVRSDIYSMGAVLYELLSGRPPFKGETTLDTLRQVLAIDPVSPRLLNPKIPRDLETICLKCLEKDPARRYGTAQELAGELGRFLEDEPIAARPITPVEKVWRWCRRKPALASVGAAALLLLLAVSIGGPVAAFRIDRERERVAKLAIEEAQARSKAEENARKARESGEEARDVLEFFEHRVLQATRPKGVNGGLGREVTIRAALDAAEPDIANSFADRPLVEASIRFVLGSTYGMLSEHLQATQQLGRALELRQAHLPADDPDVLAVMHNLAECYRLLGRAAESVALNQKTLDLRLKRFGPDDRETLHSMENLASAYERAGQLSNALPLFERTLDLCRTNLGPDDQQTLTAAHNLAEAYQVAGRVSNSMALAQQIFEHRKAALGLDNLDTLASLALLAENYRLSGNLSNAVSAFEQALQGFEEVLGPTHRDTLTTMNNLATTCFQIGERARSYALYERVLKIREDSLGADHRETLHTMENLASAYKNAGQLSNALPLFERILDLCRTKLGPDDRQTLTAAYHLAGAYQMAGQVSNSMVLAQQTFERRKATLGPDDRDTLVSLALLAESYRLSRNLSNAVSAFEQALQRSEEILGPGNRDTLTIMNNLATTCFQIGDRARSYMLYERVLKVREDTSGSNAVATVSALRKLADAYFQGGRFADAETRLWQLHEQQRKSQPEDSAALANTTALLAQSLLHQHKAAEAERLVRDWLPQLTENQAGRSAMVQAKSLLGWALLEQQKFAGAEPLLVQSFEGLQRRQAESPTGTRGRYLKDAGGRIVQLYEAWGKPEQATEWREKLR